MRSRVLHGLCVFSLLASSMAAAQDAPPADADDEITVESASDDGVAAQAFARMDSDRDGQLSLVEFEKGVSHPRGYDGSGGVVYQRLPARFRALDGDGSGFLEASEFAVMVQKWRGPGEAPALPASDRNGDGKLDFREFVALLAPREDVAAPVDDSSAAQAPKPDEN